MPARDWIDYATSLWPKLMDNLMCDGYFTESGKEVYDLAVKEMDAAGVSTEQVKAWIHNRELQPGYRPKLADLKEAVLELGRQERANRHEQSSTTGSSLTPADYARARESRKAEDEFIEQQLGGKTKAELGELKTKTIQAARTDWERKTLKGKDPESSFVLRRRMARLVEKQMESTHVE